MTSLSVLHNPWDREQLVLATAGFANANSSYIQRPSLEDLGGQDQISGDILPTSNPHFGGINTLSQDRRIFIDLTHDSEDDSHAPIDEPAEETAISVVLPAASSHRLPFSDITHNLVSPSSIIPQVWEWSSVPQPSRPFFTIFEDSYQADSSRTKAKELVATMDITSGTGNITEYDSNLSLDVASNKTSQSNKLACLERKRIIISSNHRPLRVKKSMQAWLETTNRLFDPFREDNECWFHPEPPPPRLTSIGTLRPYGSIRKSFCWQDHNGKHSLVLNFGIVSKLLFHTMTKRQKDGFVNKKWHLSHLCGNWTCLNPNHTTVEPGTVNISRNSCFSHRHGCLHVPKCMKEMKVNLGANGIPIYQNAEIVHRAEGHIVIERIEDSSIQHSHNCNYLGHEELPIN